MNSPQDPQERFEGEPAPGTRDTGSDVPSGGEDRPSGAVEGDESVPSHGSAEDPGFNTKFTNEPPRDVEPAIPPMRAGRPKPTPAPAAPGAPERAERQRPQRSLTTSRRRPAVLLAVPRHHRQTSSRPHRDRNPIPVMTGLVPRTPVAHTAPRTGASRSPLVTRHVEVGAERPPHVAWLNAVLDGLRGRAPVETGQHVVDEQRLAPHRAELAVDELVEFGQTHRSNLR